MNTYEFINITKTPAYNDKGLFSIDNIKTKTINRRKIMKIQINTDHNIKGHESLTVWVRQQVESALSRISEHITRVEVHLSDENGNKKSQNDKRCMIEARLEGHQPLAVTNQSETLEQAVEGASDKLIKLIDSTLGRLRDHKNHNTNPDEPGSKHTEQL